MQPQYYSQRDSAYPALPLINSYYSSYSNGHCAHRCIWIAAENLIRIANTAHNVLHLRAFYERQVNSNRMAHSTRYTQLNSANLPTTALMQESRDSNRAYTQEIKSKNTGWVQRLIQEVKALKQMPHTTVNITASLPTHKSLSLTAPPISRVPPGFSCQLQSSRYRSYARDESSPSSSEHGHSRGRGWCSSCQPCSHSSQPYC